MGIGPQGWPPPTAKAQQETYVSELGIQGEAKRLGTLFGNWSRAYSMQQASRTTHDVSRAMANVTTRGQQPYFKWAPVVSKHHDQDYYVDPWLCFLMRWRLLLQVYQRLFDKPNATNRALVLKQARGMVAPSKAPDGCAPLVRTLTGLASYLGGLNEVGATRVASKLDSAIEVAERKAQHMLGASFQHFVIEAMRNGAGKAHRWTREEPRAPPLPDSILGPGNAIIWHPKDKMEHFKEGYQELWSRDASGRHRSIQALVDLRAAAKGSPMMDPHHGEPGGGSCPIAVPSNHARGGPLGSSASQGLAILSRGGAGSRRHL